MPDSGTSRTSTSHIEWLDGLRGIAALWVLMSHVRGLVGIPKVPVLSWGGLAVDLFMLLSGFLMAFHYLERREREPWHLPLTAFKFWLRRWFRISPLYYILLIIAILIGPMLGDDRQAIANVWPSTATPPERYFDQSITNLLLHLSYVFGAFPQYAFRTALPDWSIALEMQFYLAFPFLMLLLATLGMRVGGLLAIAACVALGKLVPDFVQSFEMPAFLSLKLYVFVIGIWLATMYREHRSPLGYLLPSLAVAAFYARHLGQEDIARVVLVLVAFYFMDVQGRLPGAKLLRGGLETGRQLFARPFARFLGDTSYAVYLLHLLILIPTAGTLAAYPGYVELPPIARYLLVLAITVAIVYPIAWVLYRAIERPGIALGKRVIPWLTSRLLPRIEAARSTFTDRAR